MITLPLHLFRLRPFLGGGHRQLALENLALRHQLAVYKRTVSRSRLRRTDRRFWVWLARAWAGWRQPLLIVTPDTVLRWQRRRVREHWTKLSGRPRVGRPPINAEIVALVRKMAAMNPLWGAPRIHCELMKLGIELAERTVSRLMPKRRMPPSQTWRTFLAPRAAARPLRACRARPPPSPRPPLQRDRASHRCLDRSADRRDLPGRLRAVLSPPRSGPHLRSRVFGIE
jgi:hypothetical protein